MKKMALAALATLSVSCAWAAKDGKGWVVVNEDNDHYFKCERTNDHWPVAGGDAQMTVPALEAYADMITASGKVTHVFWCICGGRPNVDGMPWEPIWYSLTQEGADFTVIDAGSRTWPENALLLHRRGIDPYKTWIARCRKNGAQAWISMRMNDVHHLWRDKYFRNTVFCDSHPEMNVSRDKRAQWERASMDYSFQAVRDHHMKMFKAIVDRYDADGVEMDFCRSGTYFPEGKGREFMPLMTDFIREAGAYAHAKRGKGYGVAIRVLPDPQKAYDKGFDVATLAKEGAVDVVIPCLQSPVGNGFTIDHAAWKEVLKDAPGVVLVGGTTTTFGGPYHNPSSLAGWSAAMRARGWENLYLFNYAYMNRATREAGYFKDALYAKADDAVPRTFLFAGDKREPARARKVVKGKFVKAAFDPASWTYSVDGETPRKFEFSSRRNLRVKAKADGGDYPVLAKAVLEGVLVAEADGTAAIGAGFDWRWEVDVNGKRAFGRNEFVSARDKVSFRADDFRFRAAVKKGANKVRVEIVLGTVGMAEMRAIDPAELTEGFDVTDEEHYFRHVKAKVRDVGEWNPFGAKLDAPWWQTVELPAGTKTHGTVARVVCEFRGGTVPRVVTLNGVDSLASEVKNGELTKTVTYVIPAEAVRGGVNVLGIMPVEPPAAAVVRAALEVE
ncbi:MAG: hypothetical protein MJ138_06085 [Kiritimatiellae bacterium]|nr:hypothetical protein [Kiritimatiellia bacterium]